MKPQIPKGDSVQGGDIIPGTRLITRNLSDTWKNGNQGRQGALHRGIPELHGSPYHTGVQFLEILKASQDTNPSKTSKDVSPSSIHHGHEDSVMVILTA